MAKTFGYNPANNQLTAKGGTEIDPITFLDLYNADQANGWNVVHYYGNNTYHLDCFIYLGDGYTPTYFIDSNKLIVFTNQITSPAQNRRMIYLFANTYFQLGDLVNEENKEVNNGCVIQLNVSSLYNHLFYGNGETIYKRIYGCTIITPNISNTSTKVVVGDNTRLWHCHFVNYAYPYIGGDADIYRLTFTGGTGITKPIGLYAGGGSPAVDDFKRMRDELARIGLERLMPNAIKGILEENND